MAKLPKNKQNGTFAIARRRAKVAAMYLLGDTQQEIAKAVGVSQVTVSYDLAAVRKQWLASSLRDFDAMKGEELARLELLEREAWEAWSRSRSAETSSRTEKVLACEPAGPVTSKGTVHTPAALIPTKVIREVTTSGRTGDPRYLLQVFRCVEARLKLLGALD